jgi:hypothetical protein
MHDVNIGCKPEPSAKRDAIHFAVAPVKSADRFLPGEHVGLNDKGEAAQVDNPIGIIDPFLKKAVEPGEFVWIMLYPKTVTNLRHDWSHPAFEQCEAHLAQKEKEASIEWLKIYARDNCPYDVESSETTADPDYPYKQFMANINSGSIFYNGSDLHGAKELDRPDELFHHLSIVLGRTVTADGFVYNCSC